MPFRIAQLLISSHYTVLTEFNDHQSSGWAAAKVSGSELSVNNNKQIAAHFIVAQDEWMDGWVDCMAFSGIVRHHLSNFVIYFIIKTTFIIVNKYVRPFSDFHSETQSCILYRLPSFRRRLFD